MRRLILLSALATVGLGISTAAAQYTYPPGGYRAVERDGIMTIDPNDDDRPPAPRRTMPRSAYDPPVESQPLPSLTEREAAPYYPYDTRPRQQAAPTEMPPPSERNPGYGSRPVYGAMPPYNDPQPSPNAAPGGNYPGPSSPGYPGSQGSYPGGPQGAYPGGQYASPPPGGSYNGRPDELRQAPRPPAGIEGHRNPYGPGNATGSTPGQGRPTAIAALPPEDQPEIGEPKELAPQFKRQVVSYRSKEPAGTVIIDTPSTFLYYVNGDGTAIRYGIGVGREGFTWAGTEKISRMAEWPDWHPPAEMIERQPYLPRFMAGGASNPLGARALYLGKTIYRVHGTNQPSTIGKFVSSGCIRMLNDDVEDLYTRVKIGTKVVVLSDGKGPASNTSASR